MSQVLDEFLGQVTSCRKNSRMSHSKVKAGLFREIHIPEAEFGPSEKARVALMWLVFIS